MCCEIGRTLSASYNGSCCPGRNAFNLFSIGSELGSARSITLSSSSSPRTSSSPSPQISLSNGIIYVDGSSFSALLVTTASSTTQSTSSSSSPGLSLSSSSSPSSKTNPATTLASGHSGTNNGSSTVGVAVGTSIGAVVLVIASILLYRRWLRRRKVVEPRNQVLVENFESERVDDPQEMSGLQEHELPASARYLRQELPQP